MHIDYANMVGLKNAPGGKEFFFIIFSLQSCQLVYFCSNRQERNIYPVEPDINVMWPLDIGVLICPLLQRMVFYLKAARRESLPLFRAVWCKVYLKRRSIRMKITYLNVAL